MERDKEDLLLLFDHDGELALLFGHVLDHFIVRRAALCLLQIFTLLFELAYAHNVALDLVVNDSHRSVSDLVIREELVELGEVRVRLEDVQEVESQVDRLLVIIAGQTEDDFNDIEFTPEEAERLRASFGDAVVDRFREIGWSFEAGIDT